MTRPPFEVADIVRQHGDRFLETHQAWLTSQHRRVLRALAQCRTAALGTRGDYFVKTEFRRTDLQLLAGGVRDPERLFAS